jgi:outer membrane receptor protein involved in Fe transport
MRTDYRYLVLLLIAGMFSIAALAQNTTISGTIKNSSTNEMVSAVSVEIKGTGAGTYTDDKGNFKITTSKKLPITLVVSSVNFSTKEVVVTSASQDIDVALVPSTNILAEGVVVAASRYAERILEAPVSVERVSSANIRNTAASSYYDIIANLKGVDMVTASLLFKTPSTRGFNTSGNLRLNQLVDGMDNQAPGLNFSVGTLSGINELDVDNMELLSGASSALYGPGGMNGTLLINSKNPFKHQGLSWQVKQGVMHVDNKQRKVAPFYNWNLRWAKQVSDKFAFKFGGEFTQTKDWVGNDYRNYTQSSVPATGSVKDGTRTSDQNYNGVNVYGDETTANLKSPLVGFAIQTPILGAVNLPGFGTVTIPTSAALSTYTAGSSFDVSRTGYNESDVIDPTTLNVKLNGALHYKVTPSIEASLTANFGYGNTVYTGSDRYSLKGVKISQYKAELRHNNWFLRAYTTQEDAGESFNATVTTRLLNEAWKPSQAVWYPAYIQSLITASATAYGQALGAAYAAALGQGQSPAQAAATAQAAAPNGVAANRNTILNDARTAADIGRPAPGSQQFKDIFNRISGVPISKGGGLFFDKSNLYMAEGQYNFSDLFKVVEALVGVDYKQYVLNSQGTLFADTAGRIKINEVGVYAMVAKKLFNDRLKLTVSGRYDKQNNFKGFFTPRVSAVVKVAKDHNVRLSYQTAYRFPSTQNQWINLVIGGGVRLIGGLPQLRDHYNFTNNPVFAADNPTKVQAFDEYKPESSQSYEVGYKGLIANKLLIDVYGYYTEYKNFLGRVTVLQNPTSPTPNIYSVSVNSSTKVNTQGWGASAEYLLPLNFSVNANVYSDEIKNVPANFVAFFNAPKYRTTIGLSNSGLFAGKRIGFNLTYHYQDAVYFEGDFGSGTVPSYSSLDGQISYKFPSTKSMIKLGATNLTNNYYQNAFGNPQIGGLYYISFGYNVL